MIKKGFGCESVGTIAGSSRKWSSLAGGDPYEHAVRIFFFLLL